MKKAFVRWFCDFFSRVWAAVTCRGFLFLLLSFGVFLALIWASAVSSRSEEWQSCAFKCLVSGDEAKGQVLSGVGFILVWLVGGGLLVSFMVSRCQWLEHGGFRRFRWLLKQHLVVLGWDDVLFSELQKASLAANGCYVLTNQDACDLQARLRRAGMKDVCVYTGDYDSPKEWKALNLSAARRIFVAGEGGEKAHDARVMMVSKAVRERFPDCDETVNICDFGLASKLPSKGHVTIENFHLKWGRALMDDLPFDSSSDGPGLNLFVVGLGAMGKAVIKAAYEKFGGGNVTVVVTDDDDETLAKEVARFKGLFPACVIESLPWLYGPDADNKADDRLAELYRQTVLEKDWRPLAVVVAKKRAEKGWAFLLELMDIWEKSRGSADGSDKVAFALNQEIEGNTVDLHGMSQEIGGGRTVRLFGFRRGCAAERRML